MNTNDRLLRRAPVGLVLSVLLLLAAGCKKDLIAPEQAGESGYTTEEWEGTTYMSLALRGTPPKNPTTGGQTEDKTGGNYQVTWKGDDIIENFAVYIVSDDSPEVKCIAGLVTDATRVVSWDPAKQELILTPFKSAPVNKQIFAFFNIPTQYRTYLGEVLGDRVAFLKRIAEPIPYMGQRGITYSSGDVPTLEAFRPDSHIATKSLVTATGEVAKNSRDLVALKFLNNVTKGSKPFFADVALGLFDITHFASSKEESVPLYKRADRILSSGVRSYTPEDNITEDQVKNDGRNLAQVYTRRALAQAVVTADEALVDRNLPQMKGMKLEGVSFQVFNFEPTFYPIAQTSDNQWPGNQNTITPCHDQTDGTSLINFSTYQPTIKIGGKDEKFNAESLVRDRFFRSSHFLLDNELTAALDPTDKDFAQLLLRQADLTTNNHLDLERIEASAPVANTTFWGGCYVTETTHKWATDASSGYNTANTPFFAVVAFFDANELPWSDATKASTQAKINAKAQDLENELKEWRKQLKEAEDALAALPPGADATREEEAADAAYQTWYNYIVQCKGEGWAKSRRWKRLLDQIATNRNKFKSGESDEQQYKATWTRARESIRMQLDAAQQAQEDTNWTDTFNKDKAYLVAKNDPNAARRLELNNKITALKKKIQDKQNAFKAASEWYPKDPTNQAVNQEYFTPFLYEQGINRIFYSLVDEEFYLNYHEIPMANRGGVTHTLAEGDAWLAELRSKLPNGKDFPTEANGAPADAAVLAPSDVLPKLSQLMNGTIKEIDLTPAERRSMDFYLYGRVAPGLVQYFGGANRTEPMDLHSGYVAWYTANNTDRVVSYPCYIRYREERIMGIRKPRLMMVYYAWLNPNTGDPSNSYASPVLRNNIYHMHITGFTRMGLSAIPFVPEMPHDSPYRFLNTRLDPDEVVPTNGAPLATPAMATGAGQAASLSNTGSSSFRITF